jgi:phage terminase large subunit
MKIKVHKEIFNPVYLPVLEDYSTRFLVFYGGAGSGKSYFCA